MDHSFLRGVLAGTAGALGLLIGCERVAEHAVETPPSDEADASAEAGAAMLTVVNLADDFTAFYDATADLATSERVEVFKRDIAPLYPEFYSVERYQGDAPQEAYDQRIAGAIETFGEIREKYIVKVERFGGDLDANVASFLAAFPDFATDAEIHLIHTLGEMDGGTRNFDGKVHLIFGADGMVRYHSWDNETPFFHHELFHLHHSRFFDECEENWCALWVEGLATLVSERMNEGAPAQELLLDFPPGLVAATEEKLAASFAHLKTVLSSAESKDYRGLFTPQDDGTGLPRRRGYYLGLLVARELAKTHEVDALAKMSNDEMKPLLFATVDALALRAGERN